MGLGKFVRDFIKVASGGEMEIPEDEKARLNLVRIPEDLRNRADMASRKAIHTVIEQINTRLKEDGEAELTTRERDMLDERNATSERRIGERSY